MHMFIIRLNNKLFIEDTFLLLDALEQDEKLILQMKPRFCLEIGYNSH